MIASLAAERAHPSATVRGKRVGSNERGYSLAAPTRTRSATRERAADRRVLSVGKRPAADERRGMMDEGGVDAWETLSG